MHPGASRIWFFFRAKKSLFGSPQSIRTINAVVFLNPMIKLFLLFSRNNVAKEFEILRKWTKKMSKIQIDETFL